MPCGTLRPAPRALHYNAPVLIEAEAIPYEPALLRGERLLVLAPHPDDEVIGCGGLVAQHLGERRAVRVLVATDGAQAGEAATREEESRRGLDRLGENAALAFLGHADRTLGPDVAPRLREELLDFRPDLILVPAPIEIHPDHLALSRAFCSLVQGDPTLFADLAVTKVAFYEVGQPLRPNALVDITDVAEAKWAGIREHATQLAQRDYVAYARGLNAYRAMTLPQHTQYAEAYYVVDLPSLRTTPFSELRRMAGTPPDIEPLGEPLPISVVIRTKDRPALLREAIESVRATGYPCEIVVVNDGGAPVEAEGVTLVHHEQSRGRAEAGNAGVHAASNAFIAFLDDDDLYYAEHLATLAQAASSPHAAWYTDAVSFYAQSDKRLRIYAQDFDRDLLLLDNFIPLPTLLLRREDFLSAGGFDSQFDLFEDWDLLIRLSVKADFRRIAAVTCEVRHFETLTSAILSAPEGSEAFRAAKIRVWEKHGIGPDTFARGLEKHKQRMTMLASDDVELRGRADAALIEAARAAREKEIVLAQNLEAHHTINGYVLRQRELDATIAALSPLAGIIGQYEGKVLEVERLSREIDRLHEVLAQRGAENDQLRAANAVTHQELQRFRVEIDRLNGLLDMIYRSRTWKLHTTLERIRGRG